MAKRKDRQTPAADAAATSETPAPETIAAADAPPPAETPKIEPTVELNVEPSVAPASSRRRSSSGAHPITTSTAGDRIPLRGGLTTGGAGRAARFILHCGPVP